MGGLGEMGRCVLVRARVAAAGPAADQALAEVDPGRADLDAGRADVQPGTDVADLVEMEHVAFMSLTVH